MTRRLTTVLATGAAIVAAFFALQSPQSDDEPLPRPTGPHATGRTAFHWRDGSRDELETKAPGDKRELMVHVFYPRAADAKGERAPYMPDGELMRGRFPDAHVAKITSMRAFSLADAPLPAGDARYPVVVFLPGGGMKGLGYRVLCEDLASHGFVVAAIDPPYNAPRVRLSDGRELGDLSPAERGWPRASQGDEEQRVYRERVVHWAHDVRFVIDRLVELDRGDGPFRQRLDLQRGVGVAGHSRGGQAAGTARLLDQRVRGGVNLDGTAGDHVFQQLTEGADDSGKQPFLWLQKSLPAPTDEQLQRAKRTRAEFDAEMGRVLDAWNRRLGAVEDGALRVYVERPGIAHVDFSDEPLWESLTADVRAQKLQTIGETRAWLRAFFDGTLRDDWEGLHALVADERNAAAKVTVHRFGELGS